MSAPHPLLAEAGALPGRHQVAELAEHFTWIPVFRELLVESLTPTVAFDLLCGPDDTGFLLESVPVGDDVGRYSYLGHRPVAVALPEGDPLPTLKELTERSVAPVTGLPPFHCGAVGYLGYEAARHFERLPRAERGGPDLPESTFLLADDLVVFDHATRSVVLVTLHRPEAEPYEAALERCRSCRTGWRTRPRRRLSPPLARTGASSPTHGGRPPRRGPSSSTACSAPVSTSLRGTRSRSCSRNGSASHCTRVRRTSTGTCAP
ncbi:hypothetical protein GCM10009821_25850 [Aeromicrobium halocynthiae]|uniref:Anthranilate synthase component 1 n=1 Tax=Aeromicrobium halocynthiae TaxID=560557 RepID=A0ABN2W5B4_9ACTN